MIYLKKIFGSWQVGDRLYLDVSVPRLFASIVDVHMRERVRMHKSLCREL